MRRVVLPSNRYLKCAFGGWWIVLFLAFEF